MNTLSNTRVYLFLTVLLFPQIGYSWNVIEHKSAGIDYVSVVAGYNGGYKLKLTQSCAGDDTYYWDTYWLTTWEIQATSNIKEWIELSNSSHSTYDLYIDNNPSNSSQSINLNYDIGSNTATIKGYLSQSLLSGFQRGNSVAIMYQKPLFSKLNWTLVSLSLKGSSNAIQEANSRCNVLREERKQQTLIYFGVSSFIGLIIFFIVLRWVFRKTKLIAKKVSNKSQEVSIVIKNKIDETRRNRVYSKIAESALDEIVREAVRQAMKEAVRPEDMNICPKCLGEGCEHCDGKGWSSNSTS